MTQEDRSVDRIRAALDAASDPSTAEASARYFQVRPGGYGEGDHFIGLTMGTIRSIVAPSRQIPFVAADWLDLLRSPTHEHRLAALVIMSERAKRGGDRERELLYRTYLVNTDVIDNWDLVDVSAGPVVGGWLLGRDHRPLDRLVGSASIWERRIAVVSTQRFIGAGHTEDTYRLAVALLDERHDLIQKALGWMLREAGKRVDAGELRGFLDEYAARLPRTTLRYAIELFPSEERAHYRGLRES